METFHGCLGSPFLQRINDPLFEGAPIIEGFDPEEVDQGEKFLDLVLAGAKSVTREMLVRCGTHIGVPVRHQRWLPPSSKHAFALLVVRFLIVCASSGGTKICSGTH